MTERQAVRVRSTWALPPPPPEASDWTPGQVMAALRRECLKTFETRRQAEEWLEGWKPEEWKPEGWKLEGREAGRFENVLWHWFALADLGLQKREFEGGDRSGVLKAIAICAEAGLVMPDWLVRAYIDAYRSVTSYEKRSWDDAFGRPHKKGGHLKSLRNSSGLAWSVCRAVIKRSETQPIDDELFSIVGQEFNIGVTATKKHYAKWKELFWASPRWASRASERQPGARKRPRTSASRKSKKGGVT